MGLNTSSEKIEEYFDKNTSIFIKIGRSAASANIHRAVWGEGVANEKEAMNHVNRLIATMIDNLPGHDEVKVMDLGCGVGAPLFYLGNKIKRPVKLTGVSISGVQIEYANQFLKNEHVELNCEFIKADFHHLPEMPLQDLIFLIEAFVLSNDPEKLLAEISKRLKPGGKVVICDDFLADIDSDELTEIQNKNIEDFKSGWALGNLFQVNQMESIANREGLVLEEDLDLTEQLNLWTWRDKIATVFTFLYKLWPARSIYMESIKGGDALQKSLLKGIIKYRLVTFRKP